MGHHKLDFTGQQAGRLRVVHKTSIGWLIECECGHSWQRSHNQTRNMIRSTVVTCPGCLLPNTPSNIPSTQSHRAQEYCDRYLSGDTLSVIATSEGITKERVRQILTKDPRYVEVRDQALKNNSNTLSVELGYSQGYINQLVRGLNAPAHRPLPDEVKSTVKQLLTKDRACVICGKVMPPRIHATSCRGECRHELLRRQSAINNQDPEQFHKTGPKTRRVDAILKEVIPGTEYIGRTEARRVSGMSGMQLEYLIRRGSILTVDSDRRNCVGNKVRLYNKAQMQALSAIYKPGV